MRLAEAFRHNQDPKPTYAGTVIFSKFRTHARHRSRAERMVYPDVADRGNDRRRSTSAPTGFGGSKCRTNQRADPGARTGQQHSDDEGHVEPITNRDADQGSAAGTYWPYPPIAHDMLLRRPFGALTIAGGCIHHQKPGVITVTKMSFVLGVADGFWPIASFCCLAAIGSLLERSGHPQNRIYEYTP